MTFWSQAIRRTLLSAVVLACAPIALAEVSIVQSSGSGWICNGPEVTRHTTDLKAIESCARQSEKNGGAVYTVTFATEYRVSVSGQPVTPPPDPDPEPEPPDAEPGEPARITVVEPTRNVDGSPLTDLEAIRIAYSSNASGPFEPIADIPAPLTGPTAIDGLPAGVGYFVAYAVTRQGAVSERSNVVSRVLQ